MTRLRVRGVGCLIGVIAGGLVWMSVITLDRMKLDDCVGAVSVHLTCGIWGTLAAGIFGEGVAFLPQVYGVLICGAAAFTAAFIIFKVLKMTMGIRVSQIGRASCRERVCQYV